MMPLNVSNCVERYTLSQLQVTRSLIGPLSNMHRLKQKYNLRTLVKRKTKTKNKSVVGC